MPGAAEHLAHALLDDPGLLGEPTTWWTEVADGTGQGVAAISRLLEAIAARTPHTGADSPLPSAAQVLRSCGGPRSPPPACHSGSARRRGSGRRRPGALLWQATCACWAAGRGLRLGGEAE
ncbi:hypothetical protein ACIG3E_32495 [Streptomyces sp. NPDC053474]|uniref:hypothetical protein n=1 Tax=Streptomyces sp. NPDC053474 TaxID=3365704 RepID=UPI0037D265C2